MRGGIRGFTLLEVLLAMAILAIIMAVVYGSFSTAGRNVEQAEAARDETDLARTLLSKITDDLANAYINPGMNGTNPNTNKSVNLTIFYGRKEEAGEGDEKVRHDSLSLTTLTNFHRPGTQETELMEAGYFFREKPDGSGYSFYRREKRVLSADAPPLEGGVEYALTDQIADLRFLYSSGTKSFDAWDSRLPGSSGLPKVVEISLTFASGRNYVTEVDVTRP